MDDDDDLPKLEPVPDWPLPPLPETVRLIGYMTSEEFRAQYEGDFPTPPKGLGEG